jgi:hypothetical protein
MIKLRTMSRTYSTHEVDKQGVQHFGQGFERAREHVVDIEVWLLANVKIGLKKAVILVSGLV